jgi:hypothetical protein
MARVTYTELIDGTTLEAETISDYFYAPEGDSLSVINGRLTDENLYSGDRKLGYPHIQKQALSLGGTVAGTRNLDYFGGVSSKITGLFEGVSNAESAAEKRFIAIPGAAAQFYLPYPAYVLLTWHIHWVNDSVPAAPDDLSDFPRGGSHMRLFINGKAADGGFDPSSTAWPDRDSAQVRAVGHTMFMDAASSAGPNADAFLRDRYKSRFWCGHKWVSNLNKGWHSASIRLCAFEDIKQTRVRARSMKYIVFKRGDT